MCFSCIQHEGTERRRISYSDIRRRHYLHPFKLSLVPALCYYEGIDIREMETEVEVGSFAVDILAEETATVKKIGAVFGAYVQVEY
jgi:hypothetical protein